MIDTNMDVTERKYGKSNIFTKYNALSISPKWGERNYFPKNGNFEGAPKYGVVDGIVPFMKEEY